MKSPFLPVQICPGPSPCGLWDHLEKFLHEGKQQLAGIPPVVEAREVVNKVDGDVIVCDTMWYYVMWYYVIFCDIPIHVHALTFVYIYICVYSVSFAPRPSNKACLSLTMRVHWYNPSLDLLLTDVHVSSDGTATYASDCFEGPHSYSWTYPINTSITVMMAPRCIYIYVLPWVEKSW